MARRSDAAAVKKDDASAVDARRPSNRQPLFSPPGHPSSDKLVARVAHELNNPLDGILRYINLAIRLIGDDAPPKVVDYLHQSRKGLMRMVQITGELLTYARGDHGEYEETGINRVVEEAVRSMQDRVVESGIVITAGYRDDDMPMVAGSKLYQVCCNLIKNALDAMPDGGTLTINTGVVDGEVVLRFEDTGVGLPDNAERVFEPFYTTKDPNDGTGLGLAICREYVEELGGTIIASHGTDGGAVFSVQIPVERCAASGGIRRSESSRSGEPTISGDPST